MILAFTIHYFGKTFPRKPLKLRLTSLLIKYVHTAQTRMECKRRNLFAFHPCSIAHCAQWQGVFFVIRLMYA